jgi:Mn2+/Fe2+ NRAMP family transporter
MCPNRQEVSGISQSPRWRDQQHTPSRKRSSGAKGLDKKLEQARSFYALILVSTGVGVGLDFVGINPVKALYWTAIINGLLAPFLLVAILVVASDKKLMQGQPSSRLGWTVVALTTVAMFAAGVAMFVV